MNEYQDSDAPTPQQLVAYGHGELDARTRARVATWLDRHPEAAAELDAEICLERNWATGPLPEPTPAEWSVVRKRIQAALVPSSPPRVRAFPRRNLWTNAASAAAIFLALLLYRPTGKEVAVAPAPREPMVTPFPVVSEKDVEILSMDAADADALVVGELPMRGPVVLAGPGDVVLDHLQPDDGMEAPMQMGMGTTADNSDGPMIVVRVARADR